ncbi:hypothetical protein [Methylobacterium brachythecii]|uniref:hypothetical protein n=1 Tax=Methylobacterium brachythecii TaxID=1176177 RepID=UPI0024E0F050|nr:hypothetical protein [Methylobacterium brachythecii]
MTSDDARQFSGALRRSPEGSGRTLYPLGTFVRPRFGLIESSDGAMFGRPFPAMHLGGLGGSNFGEVIGSSFSVTVAGWAAIVASWELDFQFA